MDTIIKNAVESHLLNAKELLSSEVTLKKIASSMLASLKKGGKLLFFGNGGSASDSQHLAAEFVGRFKKNRTPLAAVALTANTSILTAVGNDFGFDTVFSQQITALGTPDDIAVGLSTSGDSANVIRGIEAAKKIGMTTVGFIGTNGGTLKEIVDIPFLVASSDTARIQEVHILAGHILCEIIEHELFGKD